MDDLTAATATHSRLSIELDKWLKKEQKAKLALLQREADVRKVWFTKVASKEISVAFFEQILKDETFQERILFEEARTSKNIATNQLSAQREVLYTVKKQIGLI